MAWCALLLPPPLAACGNLSAAAVSGRGAAQAVPAHVPTWAYDDRCNGGVHTPGRLVRHWLTFAFSNCGGHRSKALRDCRWHHVTYCTAVQYVNANWIFKDGGAPIARAAREDWWLHRRGYADSSHRIYDPSDGGANIVDQLNPAVGRWFGRYVRRNFNSYQALFMDDSSPSLKGELSLGGVTTSQEIRSNTRLRAAHRDMARALTHRDGTPFLQIDNALTPNEYLATPFQMLNKPTGVVGLMTEGYPMSNGTLTLYYSGLLDEIAYVDETPSDFIVMVSEGTSASNQARLVQAATELLGYDGDHLISWSNLDSSSSAELQVWPEEGIVPTAPLESMSRPGGTGCLAGQGIICSTGGHHDLQVAPGVYRREFRDCYDQSRPFGQCAAIVNTTARPVRVRSGWLHQSYGNLITLNGGEVQAGGTVRLHGASFVPGKTAVPGDGAILLSP